MNLIYNGNLIKENEFNAGLNNRAFTYGDGLFETLIASSDKINFFSDHMNRLNSGINVLGMKSPFKSNLSSLEKDILALIQKNAIEKKSRIKILVWRKTGGLFSTSEEGIEYIITAMAHQENTTIKEKALFYKDIKLSFSPISKYKTLSSLPYVMAGIAKNKLKSDDVVLFDTENHVAECLVSNIFWIKNNKVFTPSLETGCKDGIMKKQLINFLDSNKISWEEGKYKEDKLLNADFVFTSNVAGLIPIREVENKIYSSKSELFDRIQKDIKIQM